MHPRLIIRTPEKEPEAYSLRPDQVVSLGRSSRDNTIVLDDRHASRQHAQIKYEQSQWMLRDLFTLNGTRVNGQPVREPVALSHGDEIRIGDISLRFVVDSSDVDTAERAVSKSLITPPQGPRLVEPDHTVLQADELTSLCAFMTTSVGEESPRALIMRALTLLHQQTFASVTGFYNLDEDEPLPKIVVPVTTKVDFHLSRHLTQHVQREGRLIWLGDQGCDLPECDSLLSFTDAVCVPLRAGEATLGALHVYKAGPQRFTEREVRFCEVLAGYLANSLHVLRARRQLEADNARLRGHLPSEEVDLIGDSRALQKVRQQIARIAPRPQTVLIVGESGAGKELVALALHRHSPRRDAPLVTVNCAAIASSLAEDALFGHVRGSFTGAEHTHKGFFEQADEGTLFLDEIGELPLDCQAKLLRIIEGKSFLPVGGQEEIKVDVRIIAATHRDLEREVQAGRFRQDLFYRLNFTIPIPPLRAHADDIPALVGHFLAQLTGEYRRPFRLTDEAMDCLKEYSWPGNVRQLRSVLAHAVAMCEGDTVEQHDLHLTPQTARTAEGPPSLNLEEVEAWAIRQVLRQTQNNLTHSAKILGIHRETLAGKIKRYAIDKE
jgi:Nif-specific regulatory protein